jgi:hypothetical protein
VTQRPDEFFQYKQVLFAFFWVKKMKAWEYLFSGKSLSFIVKTAIFSRRLNTKYKDNFWVKLVKFIVGRCKQSAVMLVLK